MMKNRPFFLLAVIFHVFFLPVVLAQTTPPTVSFTTPPGIQKGTTTKLLIEGTDLTGATAIVFSEPGLHGKILSVRDVPKEKAVQDMKPAGGVKPYFEEPVKMEALVEISAQPWMATGTHTFRFITPHGSSTPGKLDVGAFPEVSEIEPNNSPEGAQLLQFPVTVNGTVLKSGDIDEFRFEGKKGQEIVIAIKAGALGSMLDPVVEIRDSQDKVLASSLEDKRSAAIGCNLPADGIYRIIVNDYLQGGSLRHFYRLTIGQFPLLTRLYPLGLQAGVSRPIQVWGYNLGDTRTVSPEPFGLMPGKLMDIGAVGAKSSWGESINVLPVAIGRFAEIEENQNNHSPQTAQEIQVPLTVNGRITRDASGTGLPDYYRFSAKKGETFILETAAGRLGSPLDSVIEVLDSTGKPVPRVTARAVWKSQIVLFDRDSKSPGLRIAGAQALGLEDYVVGGSDLMRVAKIVNGPDEDVIFRSFGGQRLAEEDTTPEAHALDEWVYKVELHPPGAQFPPNGMPVFRFPYRNDDGGPGYGKDSHLAFTAPADGIYIARVGDVRFKGGDQYSYQLTLRKPNPDFLLTASPKNPNIPQGSAVPVEVTAFRMEGFEGSIDLEFEGLPPGVKGTRGILPAGENSLTLLLAAGPEVNSPEGWAHYRIKGKAHLGDAVVTRVADGGDLLKVVCFMPQPDIKVTVKNEKIRLTPGSTAKVTVAVERFNGFKGRVPFKIQNLPFGVRVTDVGLNGIMIPEQETELTFTLECGLRVKPTSRDIFAVGLVEALVATEHPSRAVPLEVVGVEKASR
ncbi:MAG: hypothetical protein U0V70_12515 [Terriglobia bacterium]